VSISDFSILQKCLGSWRKVNPFNFLLKRYSYPCNMPWRPKKTSVSHFC
jgi:hypothetical protein